MNYIKGTRQKFSIDVKSVAAFGKQAQKRCCETVFVLDAQRKSKK